MKNSNNGHHGFTSELRLVTPAMAEEWLENNHPDNRKIDGKRVDGMVADILSNRWSVTHQGICFDGEGRLIDGQHRLTAVVKSKQSVLMVVSVNPQAQLTDPIDRMRPRAVSWLLGSTDNKLVALASSLRMLEAGQITVPSITVAQTEIALEHHADAIKSCYKQAFRHRGMTASTIAVAVWAWPVSEPDSCEAFLEKVMSGEMLAKGDPAYAFRGWRERNKRAGAWLTMMAGFNCLRYHLGRKTTASVFVTEGGYRSFNALRRKALVPHTPALLQDEVDDVQRPLWSRSRKPSPDEDLLGGQLADLGRSRR